MSAPQSELLATSKAEVGFLWHAMWRRSGGVALEGLSWALVPVCHAVRVQFGLGCSGRKPLPAFAGGMTAACLTLFSPLGASFLSGNPAARGSLGENPILWTSDGGAFSVMPFLEASSLETQLGLWLCRSFVHGGSAGVDISAAWQAGRVSPSPRRGDH